MNVYGGFIPALQWGPPHIVQRMDGPPRRPTRVSHLHISHSSVWARTNCPGASLKESLSWCSQRSADFRKELSQRMAGRYPGHFLKRVNLCPSLRSIETCFTLSGETAGAKRIPPSLRYVRISGPERTTGHARQGTSNSGGRQRFSGEGGEEGILLNLQDRRADERPALTDGCSQSGGRSKAAPLNPVGLHANEPLIRKRAWLHVTGHPNLLARHKIIACFLIVDTCHCNMFSCIPTIGTPQARMQGKTTPFLTETLWQSQTCG